MDDVILPKNDPALPATTGTASLAPEEDEQESSYSLLPQAIYNHLNSSATIDVLFEIEKEFAIPADKVDVIPYILGVIVNGELPPKSTVEALKIALKLNEESAVKIASILKDKVLNPIAGGLLLTTGIDLEPIPGSSAKDAKDLPALVAELEPYLPKEQQPETAAVKKAVRTPSGDLEPLVAGPVPPLKPITSSPAIPGMETPGLRVMKDLKPPVVEKKPEPIAPKIVAGPRPFMLHEEKPIAPAEPTAIRVDKSFSFDAGMNPVSKPAARPVAAQLGSSFDAMLGQKKPVAPVTAKTNETPKVVHYTSLRTPLESNREQRE